MFTLKNRYVYIILLAIYTYVNSLFSEVTKYYPLPGSAAEMALAFLLITVLIWEGNRVIATRLGHKPPSPNELHVLILHFAISILFSVLIAYAVAYIAGKYLYHLPPARMGITLKLAITLGTRINLFLHVVNALFFFSRRLKAKEIEAETLRRAHTQAQLQAIKNQLNPHFLFNNLNVLSALILTERPEANRFIEEFSIVYRHVLNTQQQELVSLESELEFIDHYLFLLEQRFPDSIKVEIRVPSAHRSYYIVPVALQMLIENAIKHNVVASDRPLQITIHSDAERTLIVTNNLQPKTAIEPSTRLGLKNIDQRYELISHQHINIKQTDAYFSVSLPLIETLP